MYTERKIHMYRKKIILKNLKKFYLDDFKK